MDTMANLVIRTKTDPFSSEEILSSSLYERAIRPWEGSIVYDLRYAVPAIVLLAL